MSREPILRVAINAPLSRLFDYLPPTSGNTEFRPGSRLRVPFGRRTRTGMLLEVAGQSEVSRPKLKRAHEVIDEVPLLRPSDLWLIRFTSEYYHHPVGEVVAAALPALLRQGKPLYPIIQHLSLTDAGRQADATAIARKAPKQAELLSLLQRAGRLGFEALEERAPGWKRLMKSLGEKGWV